MKLREYSDKDGIYIELMSLNLSYVYEGLIEGSRELAHLVFRRDIKKAIETQQGLYFWGFSEPNASVAERWSNKKEWPPAELVVARCRSRWVPTGYDKHGTTVLTLKWYQDDGNPFEKLADILRELSWPKWSIYQELVD